MGASPAAFSPACPFCAIVAGTAPADILHRTSRYVVFRDIVPQAPLHFLVIPTVHYDVLSGFVDTEGASGIGELVCVAAQYGREMAPRGYRVLVNEGAEGHQTVGHVHVHLLGGRALGWPPG